MKISKKTLTAILIAGSLISGSLLIAHNPKPVNKETEVASTEALNTTIHELESLFVLMQERLAVMHDVAKYKWNHSQNLDALEGEAINTENKSEHVTALLKAQNTAATKLQEMDFKLFKTEGVETFENVKDYKTDILPELNALNSQIENSAEKIMAQIQKESLPEFLKDISFTSFKQEGVDRSIYDVAVEPLFGN